MKYCNRRLRPLHESVVKEKSVFKQQNGKKILLIEAGNEANNGLLVSFPTKSSEILVIFTRRLIRAKVSDYKNKTLSARARLLMFF